MLQQDGVADQQVRAGEAGYLVVREVPRHDAEQHAERAAAHDCGAFTVEVCDRLVGEQLLCVVNVVLVDRGREVDLTECLLTWLAHLANDDVGELFATFDVQFGYAGDELGALCDAARCTPRFVCGLSVSDCLGKCTV